MFFGELVCPFSCRPCCICILYMILLIKIHWGDMSPKGTIKNTCWRPCLPKVPSGVKNVKETHKVSSKCSYVWSRFFDSLECCRHQVWVCLGAISNCVVNIHTSNCCDVDINVNCLPNVLIITVSPKGAMQSFIYIYIYIYIYI